MSKRQHRDSSCNIRVICHTLCLTILLRSSPTESVPVKSNLMQSLIFCEIFYWGQQITTHTRVWTSFGDDERPTSHFRGKTVHTAGRIFWFTWIKDTTFPGNGGISCWTRLGTKTWVLNSKLIFRGVRAIGTYVHLF